MHLRIQKKTCTDIKINFSLYNNKLFLLLYVIYKIDFVQAVKDIRCFKLLHIILIYFIVLREDMSRSL